jgi:hypothetical protein
MAERDTNPTDEIRLGTMLFTLVEPRRGHEVAYNRWYERDHFYAGCMIGPYQFAGRRFVVTKPLKDLRFPAESLITPDTQTGSYLGLYWVLDGHHDEWNRWAVTQVNKLHANKRMFAERDHIHTLLYRSAGAPSATASTTACPPSWRSTTPSRAWRRWSSTRPTASSGPSWSAGTGRSTCRGRWPARPPPCRWRSRRCRS